MVSARLRAALFAFLSILAAVEVQAADSGDCTGVVLDEDGVPLVAAKIKLEHNSGREYRAETNDAGRFTFRSLPAGDYKVEVRKEGFFLLADYAITLHAGNNELSLTLNHEQELHERVQGTFPSNQIFPQETAQPSTLTGRDIRYIPAPNTHLLRQSLSAQP